MDVAPFSDQSGIPPIHNIIERDDGQFQIGLHDDAVLGPFPSRRFAEVVARQRLKPRHPP